MHSGKNAGVNPGHFDGRKIRIRVSDEHSEYFGCENGSPQGSILSPVLFNIAINTLYDDLKELPVEMSQFADDSLFWKTARNPRNIISSMQTVLTVLQS